MSGIRNETDETKRYPFQYVEVLRGSGEGFWEVDLDNKKALFREADHKLPAGYMIHDWTEIHKTITDYLTATLPAPIHVKEIIPDRKYIFSDDPICSFAADGSNRAFNPTQKIHCTQPATVIKAGQPLCNEHADVNF